MNNPFIKRIIKRISDDFGSLSRVGDSYSLFRIDSKDVLVYFRYSKRTKAGRVAKAFYGLRSDDLKLMSVSKSFICFVWDSEEDVLLVPFNQFENYFWSEPPSADGQYKVMVFFKHTGTEMYIARVGRFNVDAFYTLRQLYLITDISISVPSFSHTQVQSLIGFIGAKKGFAIWTPQSDRPQLDYSVLGVDNLLPVLPHFGRHIDDIISEIDVIWLKNGKPVNLFEVEHTTPIYSGLLRFNDVLLSVAGIESFYIVASDDREGKFGREVNRPTFKQNHLIEKVTFLNYKNVAQWYYNLSGQQYE